MSVLIAANFALNAAFVPIVRAGKYALAVPIWRAEIYVLIALSTRAIIALIVTIVILKANCGVKNAASAQSVMICPDCGSCSNCEEICPYCEEHCSGCSDICEDCGFCEDCCRDIAAMEGCDCAEWVCVESPDWNEHYEEFHTTNSGSHNARAALSWAWNTTYHWHACIYCEDSWHYSNKAEHTFDTSGKCTVCGYAKNAKIQIIKQPTNSKSAIVRSPDEAYDDSNIAHFSVVAVGETELTYTWCRKVYSGGNWIYKPLTDPEEGENYVGPNLDILTYTDSCYNNNYLCCIITDKNGNEVRTVDVELGALHNYQYYAYYKSHEHPLKTAQRNRYGHILQCVGEGCDHTTNLRPHVDDDSDGYCDICDYEVGTLLVTKQPQDVKNVLVSSPDEDYDESNIAHFSVEVKSEGKVTYEWRRRVYAGGKLTYVPLANPGRLENYTGANLDILAPEDSCHVDYYYACFITDEEGYTAKTIDVLLRAKHNYQYYKYYKSHQSPYPYAEKRTLGHILQCVGCGNLTKLRRHVDEDNDFCCDICDYVKEISEVDITVTAPKEGNKPSYEVLCASPAYYAMGSSNNYTYRRWYVSNDGISGWTQISKDTKFVSGKYYKFSVDIQSKSNREFGTYNNTDPTIWAKVNGNYVKPQIMNGKTPDHNLTVEYNFGMCNDSVVESIEVSGITEPVVGEKPSYSYYTLGSGYQVDASKTRYEDDFMPWPVIEEQRRYYIKNGIGWFDLTKSDWLYSDETFVSGHEYQLNVYLVTDENYEFAHSKRYEPQVTATVNYNTAAAVTSGSDCINNQRVQYVFNCKPKKISQVNLKMSTPRAGKTPADYKDISLEPDYYIADPNYGFGGIWWYDSQGNMLEKDDQFIEGERYKAEIKLVPVKVGYALASQFVSPVKAYIGSNEVVNTGDDYVALSSGNVYVFYTFKKALAPETTHIPGDVDGNGVVNNLDLVLLFQYLSGWDVTSQVNKAAVDVNGDKSETNLDLVALFQYLSGWDVKIH